MNRMTEDGPMIPPHILDVELYAALAEQSTFYGFKITDLSDRERLALIGWLGSEYRMMKQRETLDYLTRAPDEPITEPAPPSIYDEVWRYNNSREKDAPESPLDERDHSGTTD